LRNASRRRPVAFSPSRWRADARRPGRWSMPPACAPLPPTWEIPRPPSRIRPPPRTGGWATSSASRRALRRAWSVSPSGWRPSKTSATTWRGGWTGS
jgi:O-acetylhomoserine sulfhydrylase